MDMVTLLSVSLPRVAVDTCTHGVEAARLLIKEGTVRVPVILLLLVRIFDFCFGYYARHLSGLNLTKQRSTEEKYTNKYKLCLYPTHTFALMGYQRNFTSGILVNRFSQWNSTIMQVLLGTGFYVTNSLIDLNRFSPFFLRIIL